MPGKLVLKFGGTSLGTSDAIAKVTAISIEQFRSWGKVVVVVSAMSGVTDELLRGARLAAEGNKEAPRKAAAAIRARHVQAIQAVAAGDATRVEEEIGELLDSYREICDCLAVLHEATPRALDFAASLGERMSARILAASLRSQGAPAVAVDATELIVTDARYGSATPLSVETREQTRSRLLPLLESGTLPVVTGYIGSARDGSVTTLGRGGSDFSASIVGAALDADEVWIYTDVDGVMTADPRLAPTASVIPELSYAEVGELAYFGANVLHPRTIRPLVERGVPLRIRNTFHAAHPGTLITARTHPTPGAVKAVTAIQDLSLVTVEGRGMIGVPGIAARTFAAVAGAGANVLMISQASSEQSICFIVPRLSSAAVVKTLEDAFELELFRHDIDRIWAQDNVVIVSAVGAGMRGTPGVAGRIFGVLGYSGINVIAIAQGSSEGSVSVAVSAADSDAAVRRIHSLTIEPAAPAS